jgi:1-pyrroline-5-carboxylate dehydrogenase
MNIYGVSMVIKPFANQVPFDFTLEENVRKQKEAIEYVRKQLGKEYPNICWWKRSIHRTQNKSINPANHEELIGTFQKEPDRKKAEDAMQAALKAFETWKYTSPEERAAYLLKAAEVIRQRRFEINAWMILEAGKNFAEADADTCVAIEFSLSSTDVKQFAMGKTSH